MTQTLTEQCKNGRLPDGYYWCKTTINHLGECRFEKVDISDNYLSHHYEEIIERVPNLFEVQALKAQLKIAREALSFYGESKHFASSKQDRQYFDNFDHSYNGFSCYKGFSCYMWDNPLEKYALKVESGSIARKALAQMDELKGGVG